jgi:segregation and condensation protein B
MVRAENRRNGEEARIAREIEALLFASEEPLSLRRLSSLLGISSTRILKEGVELLNGFYREQGRSFEIVEVAGGYQMTTLPEYAGIVAQLFKSKRKATLSKPSLETLAIIAFKQPISRLDIEQIRGVNCDGVLSTLVERELIEVTGRGEGVGRPFLYSTTKKFLEYLGLKDYRDLPDMAELERTLELTDQMQRPLVPQAEGPLETDIDSERESQTQEEGSAEQTSDE